MPRNLTIEIVTQPSQDFTSSPDYSTPVEQQFYFDYEPGLIRANSTSAKSPAMSPIRQPTKRARHVAGGQCDSEATSQPSPSTRSVGDTRTSSKSNSAAQLPPVGRPKTRFARPASPDAFKNPFLIGKGEAPVAAVATSSTQRKTWPCVARLNTEFKLGKEIGSGSSSKVFEVLHRIDGVKYAVKRSKHPVENEPMLNQWLQEVQVLAATGAHPNIVQYYSAWIEEDTSGRQCYIQLELCDETLAHVAKQRGGPLKEHELLDIAKQMACALAHLHARGTVHLDVKPENIYRTESGTYKLGDFGLATLKAGKWHVSEGDARYCPHELLQGNHHALDKADIFCLGATLYELATASPLPTGGANYQKIRQGKLALLPTYSHNFMRLLKSMMAEQPEQRPSAESIMRNPIVSRVSLPFATVNRTLPAPTPMSC